MQKLIIINGPCGIGKSTLAKDLHKDMPRSVLIAVDDLRKMINGCREDLSMCSKTSLALAHNMMETSFDLGHDVIYEKILLGASKYDEESNALEDIIKTARDRRVQVHEFIIWAERGVAINRLEKRGFREGGSLTLEKAMGFYDEMAEFRQTRLNATVVDNTHLSPEETLREVERIIEV